MKKYLAGLLVVILILITPTTALALNNYTVLIEDEAVNFNEATGYPFVDENNRTQVPFRATMEAFGATVNWDSDTRTAIAEKDGIRIEVPIGEKVIIKNGEKVENDTAAVIVQSKTYLPIRKVLEAFGYHVSWDGSTNTITVNSGEDNLSQENNNSEELNIKEKLVMENDIKLFTLFAFLNYTGYDAESNPNGYHEVRKLVRQDLESLDIQISDKNYYKNKNLLPLTYIHTLRSLGEPPYFNPNGELMEALSDLPQKLEEFYREADIETLYKKYQPYYTSVIEPFYANSLAGKLFIDSNNYFRLKPQQIPTIPIEVNLLDSFGTGYALDVEDAKCQSRKLTIGPSEVASSGVMSIRTLYIEYLHFLTNPILEELKDEINKTAYKLDEVPEGSLGKSEYYNNWYAIVSKSLVRTMRNQVVYAGDKIGYEIEREFLMKQGFILTDYFSDRFNNEFKDYQGDLKDFIKMMIMEIE